MYVWLGFQPDVAMKVNGVTTGPVTLQPAYSRTENAYEQYRPKYLYSVTALLVQTLYNMNEAALADSLLILNKTGVCRGSKIAAGNKTEYVRSLSKGCMVYATQKITGGTNEGDTKS